MCTHIYTYVYICIHINTCIHIYTFIYIYIHIYIHIYIYIYTYIYIHTYIYIYICICIYMYTYVYEFMNIYKHTHASREKLLVLLVMLYNRSTITRVQQVGERALQLLPHATQILLALTLGLDLPPLRILLQDVHTHLSPCTRCVCMCVCVCVCVCVECLSQTRRVRRIKSEVANVHTDSVCSGSLDHNVA